MAAMTCYARRDAGFLSGHLAVQSVAGVAALAGGRHCLFDAAGHYCAAGRGGVVAGKGPMAPCGLEPATRHGPGAGSVVVLL